jgi:hypothetical protein
MFLPKVKVQLTDTPGDDAHQQHQAAETPHSPDEDPHGDVLTAGYRVENHRPSPLAEWSSADAAIREPRLALTI